jgi:hypothetical protein
MAAGKEKLIMTWLRIVCACLLAGAIGAVLVQMKSISGLRAERDNLQQRARETAQLIHENERITHLRAENQQVLGLMNANKDLPKLRNELRQLRDLKREIDGLRLANQRLAVPVQAGALKPNALAGAEGFVPSEKWTYGLGTPEAAIQTWFLAMREGNWQQFAGAFSPDMQKQFERQFRNKTDEQRMAELKENMAGIAGIVGYQIASKEEVQDDIVKLGVRAAVDGEVMIIQLRRHGEEWKIDGGPQ